MRRNLLLATVLFVVVAATTAQASSTASSGPCIEFSPARHEDRGLGPQNVQICAGALPPAVLIGGGVAGVAVVGGGGLAAWLGWLRWLPALGGFTRLRSDKLLEQPVRKRLHEAIHQAPGIHHRALVEDLGLGSGQASHHLAMLVRARILTAVRRKGYTTYFLRGHVDAPVMEGIATVRSKTAVRALRSIGERPGSARRPLARDVGCSEASLRYHVRRFADAGLVHDEEGLHLLPLGEQVVALLPDVGAPRKQAPGAAP